MIIVHGRVIKQGRLYLVSQTTNIFLFFTRVQYGMVDWSLVSRQRHSIFPTHTHPEPSYELPIAYSLVIVIRAGGGTKKRI